MKVFIFLILLFTGCSHLKMNDSDRMPSSQKTSNLAEVIEPGQMKYVLEGQKICSLVKSDQDKEFTAEAFALSHEDILKYLSKIWDLNQNKIQLIETSHGVTYTGSSKRDHTKSSLELNHSSEGISYTVEVLNQSYFHSNYEFWPSCQLLKIKGVDYKRKEPYRLYEVETTDDGRSTKSSTSYYLESRYFNPELKKNITPDLYTKFYLGSGLASKDLKNIVIGVIDSGFDYNRPEIQSRMINSNLHKSLIKRFKEAKDPVEKEQFLYRLLSRGGGFDFSDYDFEPYEEGENDVSDGVIGLGYHGTQASYIATLSNPNSKFFGIRGIHVATSEDHIRAVHLSWLRGARLINGSFGNEHEHHFEGLSIAASRHKDMLFFFAAQNQRADNDQTPIYPASFKNENIVTVTLAAQGKENPYISQNYGAKSVDLAAFCNVLVPNAPVKGWGEFRGSSCATPVVTNIAAKMLRYNPYISAQDIKKILIETSTRYEKFKGKLVSEGVVNSVKAVERAKAIKAKSLAKYKLQPRLYLVEKNKDGVKVEGLCDFAADKEITVALESSKERISCAEDGFFSVQFKNVSSKNKKVSVQLKQSVENRVLFFRKKVSLDKGFNAFKELTPEQFQ